MFYKRRWIRCLELLPEVFTVHWIVKTSGGSTRHLYMACGLIYKYQQMGPGVMVGRVAPIGIIADGAAS